MHPRHMWRQHTLDIQTRLEAEMIEIISLMQNPDI
jgi:hypothetical protein